MWSLDVVSGIPEICDALVSTDDPIIAQIARDAGALVPWLRPEELASDTASSFSVCKHALDWYETAHEKIDGLLLLQPTSPFRTRKSVLRGIDLFHTSNLRPVVAVSPAASHPQWCFRVEENKLRPFSNDGGLELRSQDLPAAFAINGAFYLISPNDLRRLRSFFSEDMVPLIMDEPRESIDIDSEWDWEIAELALASMGSRQG